MDKYDLEQAIMVAWSTSDDIQLLIDEIGERGKLTQDEMLNILQGIKELHQLRSDKLFRVYERVCFQKTTKSFHDYSESDNSLPF